MTEKELDRLLESMGVKEPSGKKGSKKSPSVGKKTAPKNRKEDAPKGKKSAPKTKAKAQGDKSFDEKKKNAGEKKVYASVKNQPKRQENAKSSLQKAQKGVPVKKSGKKTGKLKVMMLGGLGEIGKNITALEYENDIIVIDCGMGFPDEEMFGVDLVIPDFTYLEQNRERVRGVLLTHGHEDHIGGVPYLLRALNTPVYGTRLTLGILEKKLEEFRLEKKPMLRTVEAGDTVRLGEAFSAEFIHVNHSIADSCALAIRTPLGTVIHSGDFKLDVSPIDGKMMDLTRLGELGNEGVELLLCESTNAERAGFTPSERIVGSSLEQIFLSHPKNRLVIATFSSNVHRVQQIINASARHGRRVAVLGRSMVNIIGAAVELGYMDVPEGTLIDVSEMRRFKPSELTLVTTGSQGEPMSALHRMAFGEHDRVKLTSEDVVIISATAIPGNEKYVGKIINALVKSGVGVIHDHSIAVHVSGHACREELKLMHALTKPKYFMPIHGEARHLYAHKELAEYMGMPSDRIFVSETGKVLELDAAGARFRDTVPAGNVLIDGSGVGDVGSVVLRDRKHLAEDGLIVAVAVIDSMSKSILSGPDLVTRGFVYVKESGDLMDEAKETVRRALEASLRGGAIDYMQMKTAMRDALAKFVFKKTKRRPMVLPLITQL
jgi:ribonuclease J